MTGLYIADISFAPGTTAEQITMNMEYPGADKYRASGYEKITVNSSYTGGVVKQFNGISFSRVFDAGHAGKPNLVEFNRPFKSLTEIILVSAYQPETVYQIFQRVMFSKDVATGKRSVPDRECARDEDDYVSTGPSSSWQYKNKMPPPSINTCYLPDAWDTCTPTQLLAIANGTAVLENNIIISPPGISR